ncbi:isopentenyl-diphosphate Delta-isomerase [bacterium SCSIO 12741]|nr:isopentenyl-diphosphate Delta-isomerase [bacterium SCSIO 12741]
MNDVAQELVILVDPQDRELGLMEKMVAHENGLLHRAFSVFLFNTRGEMLIHKRAEDKYHSGGLWTNACCSHPRPGETVEQAAHRRLQEEMGFDCDLQEAFSFTYRAELDHEMTEYEFDHVVLGTFDGPVTPNPEEVADYRFVSLDELQGQIDKKPEDFTVWFRIALPKVMQHLNATGNEGNSKTKSAF